MIINIHEKIDEWTLIQNDRFEEACKVADDGYLETGQAKFLRNKTEASFHLKRYRDVISDCEKCIQDENGESSWEFIRLGIAHWALGELIKAIELWQSAQKCNYKDAAGGMNIQVFLYFAAIKTKQEKLKLSAIKGIKKILKSKRSINYPGPVGHFLLGEMTKRELTGYVSKVPILRERQICQAHFAMAIQSLEAADLKDYYRFLKACINYGPAAYLEHEYYMAKIELENKPGDNKSWFSFLKRT